MVTFSVKDPAIPGSLVTTDIYNSTSPACVPSSSSLFGLSACLPDGTVTAPNCDYDSIFSERCDEGLGGFGNPSQNLIWETRIPNGPLPELRYVAAVRWVYTNATYQIDMSPQSNGDAVVSIPDLPSDNDDVLPLSVDPTWILAGWSTFNNSNMSSDRTLAGLFMNATLQLQKEWLTDSDFSSGNFTTPAATVSAIQWQIPVQLILGQAATIFNYASTPYSNSPIFMNTTLGNSWDALQAQSTPDNPIFSLNFKRRVWMYGIQDRRTARLGIVVVILRCIVVLLRTIIVLVTANNMKEPLELVVAALEYQCRGDFTGVKKSEKCLSRVLYQIREEDEQVEYLGLGDKL